VVWQIIIFILVAALTAVMLLRLRVRAEFSASRRAVFVGLGRTGTVFDLRNKQGTFRIGGRAVRTFPLQRPEADKAKAKPKVVKAPEKPAKRRKLRPDRRSLIEMARIAPRVVGEVARYFWSLLTRCTVEVLEGEIEAGFESPDLTGQAFGYYQAALGVFPQAAGHFQFVPVWTERTFSGAFRASVTMPLYHFVFQTFRLAVRIPIRLPILRIMRLYIGMRKGDTDVRE
jgi:hypothetical protein